MPGPDNENLIASLRDGRTAGYAVYGDPDGAPLLALHGAPACRLMFSIAGKAARARGLRIVAPDRPGYGLTPPDRDASLAARAQWLVAFADAVGLERFRLLGVSGGAPYAVALAGLVPDRVSGLALVSPMGPVAEYQCSASGLDHPLAFSHRQLFLHTGGHPWVTVPAGSLLGVLVRIAPEAFLRLGTRFLGDADAALFSRPEVKAYFTSMLREAFRQGAYGGTSDLAIYGRPWNVDFKRVTMPAIVWQGTDDNIVPLQAAQYLARLLPQCSYVPIKGAGHFWVLGHVREVINAIGELPH